MEANELTDAVIGAAIEVHRALGPGLLESAYEQCLCRELGLRHVPFQRQVPLPVSYKGVAVDCGYRIDVLVADRVVVELKAAEGLSPLHKAQLLTYLKLGGWQLGLLINFNVPVLIHGVHRMVLGFNDPSSSLACAAVLQTALRAAFPIACRSLRPLRLCGYACR